MRNSINWTTGVRAGLVVILGVMCVIDSMAGHAWGAALAGFLCGMLFTTVVVDIDDAR